MPAKIFLTGATGYIGGDTLYQLNQSHPDFEYALLIRTQEKADKVLEQYPKARIVLGGLDDSETLRREAAWANIVIRKQTPPLHHHPSLTVPRHRRLIRPRRRRKGNRPGPRAGPLPHPPRFLATHRRHRHPDVL